MLVSGFFFSICVFLLSFCLSVKQDYKTFEYDSLYMVHGVMSLHNEADNGYDQIFRRRSHP